MRTKRCGSAKGGRFVAATVPVDGSARAGPSSVGRFAKSEPQEVPQEVRVSSRAGLFGLKSRCSGLRNLTFGGIWRDLLLQASVHRSSWPIIVSELSTIPRLRRSSSLLHILLSSWLILVGFRRAWVDRYYVSGDVGLHIGGLRRTSWGISHYVWGDFERLSCGPELLLS